MTVDPARLLQMLEPTVRPGHASAVGGVHPGKPAFEDRTFDDLLNEASTSKPGQSEADASKSSASSAPLNGLAGLSQVENAALRNVLAKAHGFETNPGKTG